MQRWIRAGALGFGLVVATCSRPPQAQEEARVDATLESLAAGDHLVIVEREAAA